MRTECWHLLMLSFLTLPACTSTDVVRAPSGEQRCHEAVGQSGFAWRLDDKPPRNSIELRRAASKGLHYAAPGSKDSWPRRTLVTAYRWFHDDAGRVALCAIERVTDRCTPTYAFILRKEPPGWVREKIHVAGCEQLMLSPPGGGRSSSELASSNPYGNCRNRV